MTRQPLTAIVLAGGRSRRMGTNKALLSLEPGGPPVVQSVVDTLGTVADEVLLSASDPAPYAFLDLSTVPDMYPDTGPLGGIYSGLLAAQHQFSLVVACDMPFLSPELLRYMASLPREYDVLVPRPEEPEPTHAIYSRACLPWIEEQLRAGRYKITGWFDRARVRYLERDVLLQHDPELRSFFDTDTPEEWELARGLAREA